jgi:hypothetical protein
MAYQSSFEGSVFSLSRSQTSVNNSGEGHF